jgi:mRNA-degrading endonuclease RelE of RelBE toxin-antitoxin system
MFIIYTDEFSYELEKLDNSISIHVIKKIKQSMVERNFKKLKHFNVNILKVGQYRVGFLDKEEKRILLFVGTHKEYEEWYSKQTKEKILEILKDY